MTEFKTAFEKAYEHLIDLRNRISLDGDDTIYEEDHLLLDFVADLFELLAGDDVEDNTLEKGVKDGKK